MIAFLLRRRAPLALLAIYLIAFAIFSVGQARAWLEARNRESRAESTLALFAGRLGRYHPNAHGEGSVNLTAQSETQAMASLDELVRDTVASAGGQFLSSRNEDGRPSGKNAIRVSATFSGDIQAAQAALFKLETGRPLIVIDKINVEPRDGAAGSANPILRVSMQLESHWSQSK